MLLLEMALQAEGTAAVADAQELSVGVVMRSMTGSAFHFAVIQRD